MGVNDIKVRKFPGYRRSVRRDDRNTTAGLTVKVGEPIKRGGPGGNFCIILADGDPEAGTDIFLGIAAKESTETATLDGICEYVSLLPGTVLAGRATTIANADADSELLGIEGDYVAFDYAAALFTIDEDEGDNPDIGRLKIIGGDVNSSVLYVIPNMLCTEHASALGNLGQQGT